MGKKVFILTPSQGRRIIAKGIIKLPQIQKSMNFGKIFVCRGATNAYILEELFLHLQINKPFRKNNFVAGQIIMGQRFGKWGFNPQMIEEEILLNKGQIQPFTKREDEIDLFSKDDIIIKGGNALDVNGIPAVLVGGKNGGTIAALGGLALAKGIEIICPIGLEKTILGDVMALSNIMGTAQMELPEEGGPCGLIPMPYATVFTELNAFEILFDCESFHVASGGVGGAEGCVSVLIETYDEDEMKKINQFMQSIGEEPVYQPNIS